MTENEMSLRPRPGETADDVIARVTAASTAARLEYLRGELRAERISYGEVLELQSLADQIPADDLELREAAGLPEFDTGHDFRVTVDYGDDRIRTYKVRAASPVEAEKKIEALQLFSIAASDDADEYEEEWDDVID